MPLSLARTSVKWFVAHQQRRVAKCVYVQRNFKKKLVFGDSRDAFPRPSDA
jgi:hypothetical protein